MRTNATVSSLSFSVIRTMSMRARAFEDAITLGIGEPDMDTPHVICNAAHKDVCAGYTHYEPSQGDPELLEALADNLCQRGFDAEPDRIIVTHGAMHALACAMRTLLEPGDEVIVPAPFFSDYAPHVQFAGGRLVQVPTNFENGFIPSVEDLEKHVTERTRVLLLNSPGNPTGVVYSAETLDALADFAKRRDLVVISDEVYDRVLFDGEHDSIAWRAGMADRTLVVNSFSKTYAMTGWRVGYVLGPKWLVEQMLKVVSYTTASVNTPGQRAAIAALKADPVYLQEMTATFYERSHYLYDRLKAMPGIRVNKPRGTFYLFPSVTDLDPDGERFALELLDQEHVVTIPGFPFGPGGESCIRLASTVAMPKLEQAMDRMEKFVQRKGAR